MLRHCTTEFMKHVLPMFFNPLSPICLTGEARSYAAVVIGVADPDEADSHEAPPAARAPSRSREFRPDEEPPSAPPPLLAIGDRFNLGEVQLLTS